MNISRVMESKFQSKYWIVDETECTVLMYISVHDNDSVILSCLGYSYACRAHHPNVIKLQTDMHQARHACLFIHY